MRRQDSPLSDTGWRAGSWGRPRLSPTRWGRSPYLSLTRVHGVRFPRDILVVEEGIKGSNRHPTCREPSLRDLAVGRMATKVPRTLRAPRATVREGPSPISAARATFSPFPRGKPDRTALPLKTFGGPHRTVAQSPPLVRAREAPPEGPGTSSRPAASPADGSAAPTPSSGTANAPSRPAPQGLGTRRPCCPERSLPAL